MTNSESIPGHRRPGRRKGWRKGGQYSKAFIERSRDTAALRSSVDVYKARVAAGLGERLAPELAEGETMPDFGLSLELVARSVESALERLEVAETRYLDQCQLFVMNRRESEKLARRQLHPRVVAVRRLIESQCGRKVGREVHGMTGRTLRKPGRLHSQMQHLVWALEAGRGELPPPLLESVASKREQWLREIQPGYQRLTGLIEEQARLRARENLAQVEKDAAIEEFDAAYGEGRRLLAANFSFAGLADKLTRWLRSQVHQRLLAREARRKREERADGRVKQALRSAAESVTGWIGRRPKNVA